MLLRTLFKRLPALVFAGLLVPSLALAQPPTAKQRAEQRYREGLELAKAGKSEAALAKFDEANGLSPSALATYQVARMEHALGHARAALIGYRKALREEGLPTAERSEALRAVEELKTKVGVITIESLTPGASISVDGNPIDDPKQPIEVAPGSHVIKATLGGESRVVDARLDAGKVFVAKISFDEPTAGAPTPPPTTPPPSAHPPDASRSASYWTTPRWIGVGLAGLGAVGMGLTVGFTLVHESNVSKQEDLAANPRVCADVNSTGCRSFTDHGDSADAAKTGAIVSGIVAGAAAIGAVVLLWPRSDDAAPKQTRLIPGPGSLVFLQTF